MVNPLASNPGFSFQILSHSFGEKLEKQNPEQKAWLWIFLYMFWERHCTGVVYNETAMLSRTFSPVRETILIQLHFGNLHLMKITKV